MTVELMYGMKMKELASSAGFLEEGGAAIRGDFVKNARKEATVGVCVDLAAGGVGGGCVVPAAINGDVMTTTFAVKGMGTSLGSAQFQFPSRAADIRAKFTSQ